MIDAPSADAIEVHTQQTHVWHTGERLELLFDLQGAYVLESVHFWNYSGESYDVDNVDFIFTDDLSNQVGAFSFSPELSESNSTASQTIEIDFDEPVRFVEATITGSNGQSDFQNIGFTARKLIE